MFAKNGIDVVETDYSSELIETLNEGKIIFEGKGIDNFDRVGIYGLTYKENVDGYIESLIVDFIILLNNLAFLD